MLALAKKAQDKEDKNKLESVQKAKEIADKEKNVAASSDEMGKTAERAAIGSYIYGLFVPKGKFYEVQSKGKTYYDTVKGQYTIRTERGIDKWTLYKNRTLYFRIVMKQQDEYLFYVTENALNSINVDDDIKTAIGETIESVSVSYYEYKFNLNYQTTKEVLSELCLATGGKRNTIIEDYFD